MVRWTGNLFPQFLRFALVGGLGTAVHYAILLLFVHGADLPAAPASAIGAVGGALTNYFLNYSFTFACRCSHLAVGSRYATLAVSGWLLNFLLMTVFTHVVGWHYLFAQVMTTLLCLLWNFAGSRLWAFRET